MPSKPLSLALVLSLAAAPVSGAALSPSPASLQADARELTWFGDKIAGLVKGGPAAVEKLSTEERAALGKRARASLASIRRGDFADRPGAGHAAKNMEAFLQLLGLGPAPYPAGHYGAYEEDRLAGFWNKADVQNQSVEKAPAFWDGSGLINRDFPLPVPNLRGEASGQAGQGLFDRIYHPAVGEYTKWQHAPIKLVAYPVTKILYDLPNMATSVVTESVSRSPLHNFLGAVDTVFGVVRAAVTGVWRMIKGILNPKNASLIDGALQVADAGVSVAKGALSLAKAGASVAGYPIYRLLGGQKSVYAPLQRQGKRAAIVFIDSAVPYAGILLDAYGDQIVRYSLAQTADYYCAVTHNNVAGSLGDCLRKMPRNTKYVDFIALTHSGGTHGINQTSHQLPQGKPGLIVSIGCYDDPSGLTEPENTMGQQGLSWAVHYYLSGLMDKRLRGIPIQQAAMQAYNEGRLINAIDPVSLGAILTIGYRGSKPALAGQ